MLGVIRFVLYSTTFNSGTGSVHRASGIAVSQHQCLSELERLSSSAVRQTGRELPLLWDVYRALFLVIFVSMHAAHVFIDIFAIRQSAAKYLNRHVLC